MSRQFPYQDILDTAMPIELPRPRMSRKNRGAQFAPFAALTGYEEMMTEEGRTVTERPELDENLKELLDRTVQELRRREKFPLLLRIEYFVKDERKIGGRVQRQLFHCLGIENKRKSLLGREGEIPLSDILSLELF